jgi:capsular polysaccharide biosynthesis protein
MKSTQTKTFGLALLIVGLALCYFGLSLLLRAPQYQATARIKVEPNRPPPGDSMDFDPYFIQTTFEIIQSEIVLSNVVTTLNLEEVWSKKFAGDRKLTLPETMSRLKRQLILAPVRNTKLVSISFISEDPKEAADVANAIAQSYQDYRVKTWAQQTAVGLKVLEQEYQDKEKQIEIIQTNVNLLREQFKIQDGFSTNRLPEQQPYWDEKSNLEELIQQQQLFRSRLEAQKIDQTIPKTSMVQIVDAAEPPKFPISPNRFLGGALLVVGFIFALGGILLLKPEE